MTADASTFTLWNPEIPFPSADEMPDLDMVTHRIVERARPGGFHYLHTTTLAWHNNDLYMGWANHPIREVNLREELVRGRRSHDGGTTWEPAEVWVAPPTRGSESFNHTVIASRLGKLWGFFARWNDGRPSTEIFVRGDTSGQWESTGTVIPGFITFGQPKRLPDGNWIITGEFGFKEGAMAISKGDDFSRWDTVQLPRPPELKLNFPEPTLMDRDEGIVAILRPPANGFAPVSVSADQGRTWSTLAPSNFPLQSSKPWCGRLTTGQQYLIANSPDEQRRTLLAIAVTSPGGQMFERIWKLRHQAYPRRRLFGGTGGDSFVGNPTEWSYPSAVEHDGMLYVSYTQGKEDAWLSTIPVSALRAVN